MPIVLIISFLTALFTAITISANSGYSANLVITLVFEPKTWIFMIILPIAITIILFRIILRGYSCRYKANNIEFVIYRKGIAIIDLLYKDAVSVEYKPLKFLWFRQGFRVVITMKKYTLEFDYVELSSAKRQHPEDFPFEIIRRKIEEQNPVIPTTEQRDITAYGTMRCAYRKKTAVLLMIPVAVLAVYLLVMAFLIILTFISNGPFSYGLVFMWTLMYILPEAVVEVLLFKTVVRGYDCTYKANDTEFTVYGRNEIIMHILFKDAVDVEYKPMKFLWVKQGLHVFVKTKNNTYSFDYVTPSRRYLREHGDIPFELIRSKMGEQNAD